MPELVFVVGCNAAGKSTFIRSRMDKLENFEILMTDVYKSRTKELAVKAITEGKNVVIETVFNDPSFRDLVDVASRSSFRTSLVVLFLDSIQQSINRVAFRSTQQNGLAISGDNVRINFNESFKNVANYFLYFDRTDFIYTGEGNVNQLIMSFQNDELTQYFSTNLNYPQQFATYSKARERLPEEGYKIIVNNKNFRLQQ